MSISWEILTKKKFCSIGIKNIHKWSTLSQQKLSWKCLLRKSIEVQVWRLNLAEFGRAFGCTTQSRQYIIIFILIIHFFKTYNVPKVFKVHTQAMWKADFEWVTQFWCVWHGSFMWWYSDMAEIADPHSKFEAWAYYLG